MLEFNKTVTFVILENMLDKNHQYSGVNVEKVRDYGTVLSAKPKTEEEKSLRSNLLNKTKEDLGAYDIREDGNAFYKSKPWLKIRLQALLINEKKNPELNGGHRCSKCDAVLGEKDPKHVDHIIPRSRRPDLACDINNLQILCESCNLGYGNKTEEELLNEVMKEQKPSISNAFGRKIS